ncbi:helix-turn-helix domain-containing protein [Ideonella sp. A 288]|uniref:helix-turn-helix domain-containing protein n=1 Tax=Ideonella sp. A 288 TaxID=1962181 RepID=UPI000B4BBC13|nr:helix-turn-helix domain-containing protein [Ideonella sp. A 288]
MPKHSTPGRRSARSATASPATIPAFGLYGEAVAAAGDTLHVESLQSRSRLYRWEIEAHVHQGLHQVLWLRSGSAAVTLDTDRQACSGPALIAIPPGVVHAYRFEPDSEGMVLTLSPRAMLEGGQDLIGGALRSLFASPRVVPLSAEEARRIDGLFEPLAQEFASPGSAGSPVALWLARALVWRLAQTTAQHDQANGAVGRGQQLLFTRFLELVEAHYAEHWPMARYASRLGLTPERLNRLARAESARSALDLVHDRVAREACRRLVYIAAPISQVAFELGYDDPAYFCRFFKRRLGVSPREFRLQAGASSV